MASELKVDKFTGVTTAGSILVTGEGNSTTTNLQQGLVKFWVYGNTAAALQDSFNIASGTDNGTGDYTYAITNDMVNDLYSGGANNNTGGNNLLNVRAIATGTIQVNSHVADSGSAADNNNFVQGHGDLA
tara:strand:- start:27 stop:416 length:390 start_codon:yes stop_codon:yes gene_type:complete